MALVVTLPISALMIAVLRNGGTLIKPSVPVVATQQDYERLASEYSGYFEIGEDLTINLNLDRDIDAELEMLRDQAYNEYVEMGSIRSTTRLGELSGDTTQDDQDYIAIDARQDIDYTDYEVWQGIDLDNQVILNEISEQDRVLLEQYQAMLSQVNGLVEQGIMIPVLEGDTLKYELVEQVDINEQVGTKGIATRTDKLFSGRHNFDTKHHVERIPVPVGMKWFCQVVWGSWDIYIPVGYEMQFSYWTGIVISVVIAAIAVTTSYMWIASKWTAIAEITAYVGDLVKVALAKSDVDVNIDGIMDAVSWYMLGQLAIDTVVISSTGGLGTPIVAGIKIALALLSHYLLNRVATPLANYMLSTMNNDNNTIVMNSDLVFWGNSLSSYKY
jgi:hypothetical protein